MKRYTIEYKEHSSDEVKSINVSANNKEDAYEKAVFDILGGTPYSAWVSSVAYSNGKCKMFNNFEGNPY